MLLGGPAVGVGRSGGLLARRGQPGGPSFFTAPPLRLLEVGEGRAENTPCGFFLCPRPSLAQRWGELDAPASWPSAAGQGGPRSTPSPLTASPVETLERGGWVNDEAMDQESVRGGGAKRVASGSAVGRSEGKGAREHWGGAARVTREAGREAKSGDSFAFSWSGRLGRWLRAPSVRNGRARCADG